jgi:hypothetical protein
VCSGADAEIFSAAVVFGKVIPLVYVGLLYDFLN